MEIIGFREIIIVKVLWCLWLFFFVIENSFWLKRVNLDLSVCNCLILGWVYDYEWLLFYL